MRILEIHLEVKDVDRSLKLYTSILPYTTVTSWSDGKAAAIVLKDGAALGLWQEGHLGIHAGQGGKHVHFAFQIKPEELDHYTALVKEQGLEVLDHTWPNGQKSIYFFDYDGHQAEFMTQDWHKM